MRKKGQLPAETDEAELELSKPQRLMRETCMNPWNGKCENIDIALYIVFKGDRLPICQKCWYSISSKNMEWMCD